MDPVNITLIILLSVTTVIIVVLGVLTAKLIANLTIFREAAQSINSIANNADTQFSGFQSTLKNVLGASSLVGCKMRGLMDGLVKGISFGINLFNKK